MKEVKFKNGFQYMVNEFFDQVTDVTVYEVQEFVAKP